MQTLLVYCTGSVGVDLVQIDGAHELFERLDDTLFRLDMKSTDICHHCAGAGVSDQHTATLVALKAL